MAPRLRGVLHTHAFWVAALAAILLVAFSHARWAAGAYGLCLCALFAASGAYHRCQRARLRPLLRRIDHSAIFIFIAGTSTPIALILLPRSLGLTLLIVAWSCAITGVIFTVAWMNAPRGLVAGVYVLAGIGSGLSVLAALSRLPAAPAALFIGGGVIYLLGAVVYAIKRPNPWPSSFGFHEVFHALVCLAAAAQFVAMAGWVIPLSA